MARNQGRTGRRRSVILVAVVVALLGLRWWLTRPRSITEEATRLAYAMANNRADELFDAASPQEIERTHLTRESFRKMYAELIWPRVKRFRPYGKPATEVLMAGSSAGAYVTARDDQGHTAEYPMHAYTSQKGPTTVLTHMLLTAWIFEYINAKGLPINRDTIEAAHAQGKLHDLPRLKQLGIVGAYETLTGEVVPWEHLK